MSDQASNPTDAAKRQKMTRAEAGRKGGNRTRERYGTDFFREIGRIGGSKGTPTQRKFDSNGGRSSEDETDKGAAASGE